MPDDDSNALRALMGERVGKIEQVFAVHDAVCGERYKAIADGIASLRIEMAQRSARAETAFKITTGILALLIAMAGLSLKAFM